jgi:Cu(I)/Ag(I) efflux system membrane fusion protein
MTAKPEAARRRRMISSAVFAALIVAAVVVFRKPLIAWFGGKSLGGNAGAVVTANADPFVIKASLDPDPPAQTGNALILEIRDSAGKPVDDAKVDVEYDMAAMGSMSEMKGGAKIEHESEGRYRAEFDLPMSGSWTLMGTIRAPSGTASQKFTFTVGTKGLIIAGGPSSSPEASGAMAKTPLQPIEYPQMAFDSLRAGMDASERIRTQLAKDQMVRVPDDARTLAEALKAASGATSKDRPELATALSRAASEAEHLASAQSVEDARKAFAQLNGDLLPLFGADVRLTSGWHVFECPMFEHAQWVQRQGTAENPYMGTKMPTCGNASDWKATPAASASATSAPGEIDHYTCSMHPSVKQNGPGKCPICGMDLIPVTKEQQEQGVVMIDESRRQLIGVRTGQVVQGSMRRAFHAVGQIAYDESKLTDVNLKVQGWITKLFVSQTGQRVATGQPLFSFYSPELYNAQQDFLLATQGAGAPTGAGASPGRIEVLARASRQRLHLLGLGDSQLDAIAAKGAPLESVVISSPASGFVIEKDVVEGASVDPGMRLFRIAALNKVWVEADVYEGDLPQVRVGQHAAVTLDYLPGRAYDAKVAYIYPYLDPKARTGRVRVELANKDLELRPGMYASVELAADAQPRLQVPASAVVYTGPRRLVFVDLGQGRFRPQEIRTGTEADGMYEVLEGLKPGDTVATSGIFLIAAEARISTAAKYWDKPEEEHEASPADSAMEGGSMGVAPPAPPQKPSHATASPTSMGSMPRTIPSAHGSVPSMKPAPTSSASSAVVYSCPMHPEVRSSVPGKCPKCSMDLEPMPKGGGK